MRPVWHISRALTAAEKNYDVRELEFLALIYAVEKWRGFLGKQFTVVTDHKNLLKVQEYVKHKHRLKRWAVRLSEYDVKLEHRAGKKHNDADHWSRIPANNVTCIRQKIHDALNAETGKRTGIVLAI